MTWEERWEEAKIHTRAVLSTSTVDLLKHACNKTIYTHSYCIREQNCQDLQEAQKCANLKNKFIT